MTLENIRETIHRRISEYGTPDKEKWFTDWFVPTLELIEVREVSWEELIELAKLTDPLRGDQLASFYEKCLEFNRYVPKRFAP